MYFTRQLIFLLALLASTAFVFAEVSLPSIFSDHMVLQREQPIPVWGEAEPGAMVTVEFAGQTKTATANADGEWSVDLNPLAASTESRSLKVAAARGSTTFTRQYTNVLVGDVWLCSGQSNMEWSMQRSENADTAIAAANHPLIRLYKTPRAFARTPTKRIDAQWTECNSATVKNFSAVAYYFGQKLREELDVPIGLLQSAWGGSRIEPWTPPSGFEGFDSLGDIRKQLKNFPDDFGTDPQKARHERQYPTAMYNAMIHAHIPFAIKGAIWYQGEANRRDGMLYVDKTAALLKGWRGLWGYNFPFYFVQIAPYQYGELGPGMLPEFWEAQAATVQQIPNTGMAVVHDASTLNDIHPPNKKVPGTRLALLALDNTYGRDFMSRGPSFEDIQFNDGAIVVSFDSAEGLTTLDGKAPDWFEISGEAGAFKPAKAEIKGSRVILRSPEVPHPQAVRFAWHKLATPNLINAAGLPAPAFRAGTSPSQ